MMADFLRNGRFIALSLALLIVAGLSASLTLPVTEDPRIKNRAAIILTQFPGASAERVEALVSEPIENELRRLPEIKDIISTSKPDLSAVRIILKDNVYDTEPVWSRARNYLSDIQPQLPPGAAQSQFFDDRGYAFTLLFSLTWSGENGDSATSQAILKRWADELQSRMRNLSGTDHVRIFGDPTEEILVEVDSRRAAAMQLSFQQISAAIGRADAKVASGNISNDFSRMQVEVSGELDSEQRIRSIPVRLGSDGEDTPLGSIATISRQTQDPPDEIAELGGRRGIVLGVRMLPNIRIDRWQQDAMAIMQDFRRSLSSNVEVEVIFDQAIYTSDRLGGLWVNVAVGFTLVVLVLLVTLGIRAALIVAMALPLTAAFTLAVMKAIGLPIHQMSVTGLVVALGIMVDNAIVMVDLIQQKRMRGKRALTAMMESIRHLWMPLAGSTLTTVLAFAPIVLMPGPAGEFVGGIALSVMASLIGSYIISHTLIAGMAGRLLKPCSTEKSMLTSGLRLPAVSDRFRATIDWALRHPGITIGAVVLIPVFGYMMAGRMSEQFFPPSDRDMINIEVRMPAQASIERTHAVAQSMYQHLETKQGLVSQNWFIGNSAPSYYYNLIFSRDGEPQYANGMIKFTDFERANELIDELQDEFDARWPEAQVLVRKLEQGPPINAPIEIRVFGPSLETLGQVGEDLRKVMSETQGILHSRATLEQARPKLTVNIHEEVSRQAGLELVDIAGQLQTALNGQVQGSVIEGTEELPVRVRLDTGLRQSQQDLESLHIIPALAVAEGDFGGMPLSAIADFSIEPARGAIPRRNGSRVNIIEAYTANGELASDVLARFQDNLAASGYSMPSGYRLEVGGESSGRNDAVGNLMANVGIIVVLMVIVVVMSFNSFRLSLIIFSVAGLSVGLGILCVWVFNYPFGFTVIIGLMGLMGLAINGAIVILAELKSYPKACVGDVDASVHAVMRCSRHITSTTITTVGGFMPLILEGGGFWPPFAISIAGGTILTTLLSFYLAPAAFRFFALRRAFDTTKHSAHVKDATPTKTDITSAAA